jgi:hypothetical protein
MPVTTSSLLSTLLLSIPLLFPYATDAAVIKKDLSTAVLNKADTTVLVDSAVTFTVFSSYSECTIGQNSARYTNPDAGCYELPGQSMDVNAITNTCRGMYPNLSHDRCKAYKS